MIQNYIQQEDIKERIKLINGSITDYISENGNVYKYYKNKGFFKRKLNINPNNKYVYCSITMNNKNISKRVHRLVALAFVKNPNPNKFLVVGHKDNNKQNNIYNNLYWTTTQENTQKAIDDKLLTNDSGIDSFDSQPLKVLLNQKIVAVYGSIGEATKYIKNITKSYLSKILKRNGNYKPRGKKYKYTPISKEEYILIENDFKNVYLKENEKMDKSPCVFKATNLNTGQEIICDNQTEFAKQHGLSQAIISDCIKDNKIYNNWKFKLIDKITYKEASIYENYINTIDDVKIQNIKNGEVKIFKTKKDLKDYFNIKGHDVLQYQRNNQLIFSEWKVI